ncbi:msps, partial [Symbiodinium microadriaticum]
MPLSRLLLKLLREEMARGPGIAFHMPNVDSMRAISVLNTFFNAHPATPPADDTPYCSAKTFLAQLMEALGVAEVQRIAGLLKIPQTSFLCRLINRMSGGVAGAVLEAATDKERAVAVAGVRDDVRERIVGIIDRITASRDKILPIRELHQLLKENPDADVAPYLQALSSAFRKFVIDTLAKLDGEGSARDGDPAASFRMVVDTSLGSPAQSATRAGEDGGDGSEALRILEGLKAKQGIS